MHSLQIGQFIVCQVHSNSKEQPSISSINEFVGIVFNEIGVFFISSRNESVDFRFDARLLGFSGCRGASVGGRWRRNVPFGKAGLALAILQKEKSNLCHKKT